MKERDKKIYYTLASALIALKLGMKEKQVEEMLLKEVEK
jgi:hypothetical protein